MNIIKKCWKWDESFNLTPFKLGRDIDDLLNDGSIFKKETSLSTYSTRNENPCYIHVKDHKIDQLYYRETFFDLPPDIGDKFWGKRSDIIISTLDQILTPCDENEPRDRLFVVFRDYFPAIAVISASSAESVALDMDA